MITDLSCDCWDAACDEAVPRLAGIAFFGAEATFLAGAARVLSWPMH